jgi:hypothetical protein
MKMKRIDESPKKKSRRRALLHKAKKIITIVAALAYDKHLDYNQDESPNGGNRKEKG